MSAGAVLALAVGGLALVAGAFFAGWWARGRAAAPAPVALPPVVEHPDEAEQAALAAKEKAIDATPDAEELARGRARFGGGVDRGPGQGG